MKDRTARPESPRSNIRSVSSEAGYITVKFATGNTKKIPIASVIREEDVPELSSDTVPGLAILAQLVMALFRTLASNGLLDDGIVDENYGDLDEVVEELSSLGAEW